MRVCRCDAVEDLFAGELRSDRTYGGVLVGVGHVAKAVDKIEVACRAEDLALTDVFVSFRLQGFIKIEVSVVDSLYELVAESHVDDVT